MPPTINDLFEKHRKEIEREQKRKSDTAPFEIPRDPEKRPWSGFAPALKDSDVSILEDDFETPPLRERNQEKASELPWYATFTGIAGMVGARKKLFLSALLILGSGFGFYTAQIPVTYNSTLHLYAPEKWDSISSRLPLLTNRVEFASFPIEFKVPLSLLSRRLRSEEAKNWVVSKFLENSSKDGASTSLKVETVRAETIYAATTELLMVQGFANDPDLASQITHLYWQYLEKEITALRVEQVSKIDGWIAQNLENYDRQIASVSDELIKVAMNTSQTDKILKLHDRFNDTYADTQIRKVNLQKEVQELERLLRTRSMRDLALSHDLELQEIGNIHIELSKQFEGLTASSPMAQRDLLAEQLEAQSQRAERLIKKRLETKRAVLDQTLLDQNRFQQELGQLQGQEGRVRMASEQERELQRLLFDAQTQKKILENLKAQLSLESDMGQSILKTIQYPTPDPLSIHPKPIVKYSIALALAAVLSLVLVILLQLVSPVPVLAGVRAKSHQ